MSSFNETPKALVTSYRLKLNQFQNKSDDKDNYRLFHSRTSSLNNESLMFNHSNLIEGFNNSETRRNQQQYTINNRYLNHDDNNIIDDDIDDYGDDEVFDEAFNQINNKEFNEKLKDQQYIHTSMCPKWTKINK